MISINRLSASSPDFSERLNTILAWEGVSDASVNATVDEIIAATRADGDAALVKYTNQLDRRKVTEAASLSLSQDSLSQALDRLPVDVATALKDAAKRIEDFHHKQLVESWRYEELSLIHI